MAFTNYTDCIGQGPGSIYTILYLIDDTQLRVIWFDAQVKKHGLIAACYLYIKGADSLLY